MTPTELLAAAEPPAELGAEEERKVERIPESLWRLW